jgi:hypothetical protein
MGNLAKAAAAVLVLIGIWTSWTGSTRDDAPPAPEGSASVARASGDGARSALVEVPRLVGVHDSFARHLLALMRLRPGRVRLEPSSEPWGSVIFQSIPPGSAVRPGTRVDLVLAKGSVPEPCRLYWCATAPRDAPPR